MDRVQPAGSLVAARRARWLVVALAVACRLGVFLSLPSVFDFVATGTIHGSEAYDAYARNLASTGVFGREPGVADAAIPPAYSVVLAGIYGTAGRTALAVAVSHTFLDLLSLLLLWRIGLVLTGRAAVAALAALGMAVYPYLVFQSLAVNDTSLFILELHTLLWLVVLARRTSPRAVLALPSLAGLVLGVAALTRPVVLPLAAWIVIWWAFSLGWRGAVRRAVPLALAAALVVGTWAVRNASAIGAPVLFATNGGSNFWQGNNARTLEYLRAGYDVQWIAPPARLDALDFRDPASNGAFAGAAVDYLRSHWQDAPRLWWEKARVHWSLDVSPRRNPAADGGGAGVRTRVDEVTDPSGRLGLAGLAREDAVAAYSRPLFDRLGRAVHKVYWGAALLFACVGVVLTRRAWRDVSLLWFVQANMTLAYVIFHPSTRYRLPTDPLLFLFTAAGILAVASSAARLLPFSRMDGPAAAAQQ